MTDSILHHIFNNTEITQRATDGYVDATGMCKANGKEFHDYFRLKTTQSFLLELSTDQNIPLKVLIYTTKGGNDKQAQGTLVHPKIVPHLKHWLSGSKKQQIEKQVQLDLWTQIGGIREVKTLAGSIDILTSTQLVEVKHVDSWITAVGQLLIYGSYYPSHQKRLHLFGETQQCMLEFIQAHCNKFDIVVTW